MPELYVLPDMMDDQSKYPDSVPEEKSDSPLLILLAHGSRDSRWCKTFEQGLETINARLENRAVLAYMEMASPSLETVINNHVLAGKSHFQILPLFFAEGRHLLHDVPEQIKELESCHSGISIELMPAVGHQPEFWVSLSNLIAGQMNFGQAISATY